MPIELTDVSLQMLKWGLMIGVPSFFAGWFAHMVWDWMINPPGTTRKGRE